MELGVKSYGKNMKDSFIGSITVSTPKERLSSNISALEEILSYDILVLEEILSWDVLVLEEGSCYNMLMKMRWFRRNWMYRQEMGDLLCCISEKEIYFTDTVCIKGWGKSSTDTVCIKGWGKSSTDTVMKLKQRKEII